MVLVMSAARRLPAAISQPETKLVSEPSRHDTRLDIPGGRQIGYTVEVIPSLVLATMSTVIMAGCVRPQLPAVYPDSAASVWRSGQALDGVAVVQ